MRIIGGIAGGRLIKVPKGLGVRPTPDLVRQAIFNSLGDRVNGATVLELFGGSGALSLECLSRGARSAVCIEKSGRHAAFIKDNLRQSGLPAAPLQVRVQDAFAAIAQLAADGRRFDLIMADPPYGEKNLGRRSESFAQRTLDDPHLPALLAGGGLLVLGHARRDTVTLPPGWEERKALKHGDSVFRMLQRATATDPETA
ncbi:MAG TPA: 16S rRNA (guanine(966)-N(2))-methyltransferase RsmD [Verrucomicrobiales bacterium]|nr:16S rRNA (guanine(966)-N(2))-methyltransferase RsmD [Verrucomicrobiales bacterium]